MSGEHARSAPIVMEKTVLIEFLQLYKSFPCLWDQKHMLYGTREARMKAYEVLLNKYKLIHEDADISDVKKKLEYMRCAYRREHKKVIMAKLRGDKYKPSLYYYDLLKFLNDTKTSNVTEINSKSQDTHEIEDSDDETLQSKRPKMLLSDCKNEVFLTEDIHHSPHRNDREDELVNEEQSEHEPEQEPEQEPEEREQPEKYVISTEPESFGRTVGFQLKELSRYQRFYAEKLISDIIFQARLGNLSADSTFFCDSD